MKVQKYSQKQMASEWFAGLWVVLSSFVVQKDALRVSRKEKK